MDNIEDVIAFLEVEQKELEQAIKSEIRHTDENELVGQYNFCSRLLTKLQLSFSDEEE